MDHFGYPRLRTFLLSQISGIVLDRAAQERERRVAQPVLRALKSSGGLLG